MAEAKLEKLEFDGRTVVIDPKNLRFDEATLGIYIQHEAGYYDNFGGALAWAERALQAKENLYEKIYYERFVEAKESGGSDRLAEAKAKSDETVSVLKEEVRQAKYIVTRLKQHLRAWDKNHDNAQSMGHMLRKQMDKLNAEISLRVANIDRAEIPGLDDAVASTVETDWPSAETETKDDSESSGGFETDLDMSNLF
jgi:hypothetical protein